MADPVRIVFLGGLGEIGRNCACIEVEGRIMLLDCGLMFPEADMPGIDLVLPDFTYLRENAHRIDGCVATHGHEDHVGGLSFLLRDVSFPIYGSPLTLGLARSRIEEAGLLGRTELVPVADGERRKVGPFDLEFIPVTHSVPYAFATAFHTPQGVILHSGDFKLDLTPVDDRRTDLSRVGAIASGDGVRLLLSDSTNAEEAGHAPSEREVGRVLVNLFREHEGRRIITASFASHIHRIQQIADAAISCGRVVATLGLSVKRNVRMARDLGLLHIPDASLVDIEDVADLPPGKVCVVSTGSQGEPMSALALLASGDNRWLKLTSDDTVILSSHAIPGNEHNVNKVIDGLLRVGAEVVHSGVADVHATGHAQAEELKMLMSIAKPQLFIPVHGEFRHLTAHARLAEPDGDPRHQHPAVRGRRRGHPLRRRHRLRRARARGLPLRRRHRRRRRARRVARPTCARRGRRGRRHPHDRRLDRQRDHGSGDHHPRVGVRARGRRSHRRGDRSRAPRRRARVRVREPTTPSRCRRPCARPSAAS